MLVKREEGEIHPAGTDERLSAKDKMLSFYINQAKIKGRFLERFFLFRDVQPFRKDHKEAYILVKTFREIVVVVLSK